MQENTEWLTALELSAHLRVAVGTVRLWARTGRIPAARVGHNMWRYDLAAVRAALIAEGARHAK